MSHRVIANLVHDGACATLPPLFVPRVFPVAARLGFI